MAGDGRRTAPPDSDGDFMNPCFLAVSAAVAGVLERIRLRDGHREAPAGARAVAPSSGESRENVLRNAVHWASVCARRDGTVLSPQALQEVAQEDFGLTLTHEQAEAALRSPARACRSGA
ncbi:hypothetical protein ACIQWN_37205 [Streptomyces vinaceus]|uniref:hypothetical protein n=1 Tax=Streptomyces vinaceus TaxID=1960 RepID=UPI00380E7E08